MSPSPAKTTVPSKKVVVKKVAAKPVPHTSVVKATKAPTKAPAKKSVNALPKVVTKPAPQPAVQPLLKAATATALKEPSKAKAEKLAKAKKPKLVRDSFTIPKLEYMVIDDLKQRATQLAFPIKKSELLRAGIKALAALPDLAFISALKSVPAIKTGRPSKG
jgi:hypothetical protein